MTRDDSVKKEKDILKEIAKNKEYKNRILQNLPEILYKKACLCGLVSNEEQGDSHEEMECLFSLCSQCDENQNEEKGDFSDESFEDCSLSKNSIKLKYFLLEEIFDFLKKSNNSKLFSEQDILSLQFVNRQMLILMINRCKENTDNCNIILQFMEVE